MLADAIERRRSEEEMRRQALHDPLTGLPNRTLFMDRLSLALNHAARRRTSVAVLFLDLDRFKLVNDSLGHGAGDELLCMLAGRLAEVLRPGDTVARFGGDEFCVICDDLADPELAIGLAQRMTAALARRSSSARASSSSRPASASRSPRTGRGRRRTSSARPTRRCTAPRRTGAAGFELFDAVMRGYASERLRVENDLRRALEAGDELIAHYQPIVTLDGGEIIGVEALVRWNHPERGLVSPASSSRSPRRAARSSRSASGCSASPAPRRRAGTPRATRAAQRLGQPLAAPGRLAGHRRDWSRPCSRRPASTPRR